MTIGLLSHLLNAETESLSGGLNSWEWVSPPGETEASGNAVRKPLVDGSPIGNCRRHRSMEVTCTARAKLTDPRLDLRALHAADMSDDVVDKVFTIDVVHDSSVERTWLLKVNCRIKLNYIASLEVEVDD